ncbi:MAG: DUF935 family protein [Victivallaceae bacterium]|nr:DUF935 family protein [Victivallaceae bacterium]
MRLVNNLARGIVRYLAPRAGLELMPEANDRNLIGSPIVTRPEDVERILRIAETGDTREQCLLAREIFEKNENVAHAIETRRNAVTGCEWRIEPGDTSAEAGIAAQELLDQLKAAGAGDLDTFPELIDDLTGALLPGFALSEICWGPGGEIQGFQSIEQQHVTFVNSLRPLLVTVDTPSGVELMPDKFVFHRYRRRGRDPVRGGLIRPLAWLHCFATCNLKFLLQFVEQYGTPFWLVKVSDETWETERLKLIKLVKGISAGGGAVVKQSTEITPVQAANVNGDAHFKLLDYLERAITKVVLGQTATAGDGGGWSNDGAQSKVRQDILEADCRWLEGTIARKLIAPWTRFNFINVRPPEFKILCAPPEDDVKKNQALQSKFEAAGIAVRGGLLTPTIEIEEETRKMLGYPPPSEAAKTAWEKANGVRLPITLQSGGQQNALGSGLPMGAETAPAVPAAAIDPAALRAFDAFASPLLDEIEDLLKSGDEEAALRLLIERVPGLQGRANAEALADYLKKQIDKAAENGRRV